MNHSNDESLKSQLILDFFPKIRHGFGTLSTPFPNELKESWINCKPLHTQVHGNQCGQVLEANQNLGEVDAQLTNLSNQVLAIVTADCVPILLASPGGVAAIHAGWRGLENGVITNTVASARDVFRSTPDQWVAAIGPCIGACCYEVNLELGALFESRFGSSVIKKINGKQKPHLKLNSCAEIQLRQAGIKHIETLDFCTACSKYTRADGTKNFQFYSYRRMGSGHRQYSAIQLKAPNKI